ncbi:MAG: sugar O-acetyltransferase [Bacteroidaceae bacterium]|nr:sugar O-acetyltransferase [Bacteroidaceae bacterium]
MTRREALEKLPALKVELENMQAGRPYNAHTPEMYEYRDEVKKLLRRLNITEYHEPTMYSITRELLSNSADDVYVEPPFQCDYGNLIFAEQGVWINFGCTILDGGGVYIGKKTLIAPNVNIFTAGHPLDADERDKWEYCKPVHIGERCWIGGGVTICPGVTIGDRCVIGAGAVVVKDIPADSLAVGNPARVIRKLNNSDRTER